MTPGIVYTHQNFTKAIDLKVINHNNTRYGCIHASESRRATTPPTSVLPLPKASTSGTPRRSTRTSPPTLERALMNRRGCTGVAFGHYGEMSDPLDDIFKKFGDASANIPPSSHSPPPHPLPQPPSTSLALRCLFICICRLSRSHARTR
jgi:hypothetical protein